MPDYDPTPIFEIFTEIGIIHQLSRARLETQLPKGLIEPHFAVLNHLIRVGDGATPQQMAKAFQVPKTSLTHTLKGLETRGLIVMKQNPEDGRSKTVWIMPEGRALRDEVVAGLVPEMMTLLAQLDMEKLLEIRPILTQLRKVLDDNR